MATQVLVDKDRLARFGVEFLEHVAARDNCGIVVVNQEALSPQQELVGHLPAIVHTFSCRLYGLRRYEEELKTVELSTGGSQ